MSLSWRDLCPAPGAYHLPTATTLYPLNLWCQPDIDSLHLLLFSPLECKPHEGRDITLFPIAYQRDWNKEGISYVFSEWMNHHTSSSPKKWDSLSRRGAQGSERLNYLQFRMKQIQSINSVLLMSRVPPEFFSHTFFDIVLWIVWMLIQIFIKEQI